MSTTMTKGSWGLADGPLAPAGPRMIGEPEMFGAKEAAATIGVAQPNLRAIPDLPEPYGAIAATTLWRADEIRTFAAAFQARRAGKRAA